MKKFFCNSKKGFCEKNHDCSDCKIFEDLGGEYREVPKTNADRIRAMSDEELANFLACTWATSSRAWQKNYGETLQWIQQPAEEE